MQFHFHANQSHFHKNGFALRLALTQWHKGTRKWPIRLEQHRQCGGAVASWLVRSSTDLAVWVRALAGDIALCFLGK